MYTPSQTLTVLCLLPRIPQNPKRETSEGKGNLFEKYLQMDGHFKFEIRLISKVN